MQIGALEGGVDGEEEGGTGDVGYKKLHDGDGNDGSGRNNADEEQGEVWTQLPFGRGNQHELFLSNESCLDSHMAIHRAAVGTKFVARNPCAPRLNMSRWLMP